LAGQKKSARARAATASPATVCVVHYPKMQPITTPGTPAATLIIRVQKRKVEERQSGNEYPDRKRAGRGRG